jgi:nitrite reductase (NADH) small subunit
MTEVFVGTSADFDDDVRRGVLVEGREVFVFKRNGRFHAFENRCAHSGGPVGEGTIIGRVVAVLGNEMEYLREEFSETEMHIVCPWHGWEYDIETGVCAADRAIALRRYDVVEREDGVYVRG